MRALFWLLTLAALATALALGARLPEGYVLAVAPPWRVEMPLTVFLLLLALLVLAVYLLIRLLVNTLKLPDLVRAFRQRRARQHSERLATAALRSFWEGRYSHALRHAEAAAGAAARVNEDLPAIQGVATLVALKAANALHDDERIALWQRRATSLDNAGWRSARLMAELRIALDARDYAAARQAYDTLAVKERRQIAVQRQALRLAQGEGDWAELLRLVRQLEKHKALLPAQAAPLRRRAYEGLIDTQAGNARQLERLWHDMPAADRRDSRLAGRAARALAAAGDTSAAARLIEDCLDTQWAPELLSTYAAPGSDVVGRLAQAEKWLAAHPQEGELLLALGRLCIQQQLWGKAQSFLEASLAVAPGCAAHIELARLHDRLEHPEAANRHYRAAADCLAQQRAA